MLLMWSSLRGSDWLNSCFGWADDDILPLATVASLRQHHLMSPLRCCHRGSHLLPVRRREMIAEDAAVSRVEWGRPLQQQQPVTRDAWKFEWKQGNSSSSSSSSSSALRSLSHLHRLVFLNGSRRAHLPLVRDDRTRAGLRLDAAPEAGLQAPETGCRSPAVLKVCTCMCVALCVCVCVCVSDGLGYRNY